MLKLRIPVMADPTRRLWPCSPLTGPDEFLRDSDDGKNSLDLLPDPAVSDDWAEENDMDDSNGESSPGNGNDPRLRLVGAAVPGLITPGPAENPS